MEEIICNLHIHSTYSDGTGTYSKIADAALKNKVDVVIITDHNILVKEVEKYYKNSENKVLLLTGQEVHDQNRKPANNHMLVLGCDKDITSLAESPQDLIDEASRHNGLTFLAHPYEDPLPLFHEDEFPWVTWDIHGFTGLELWNGFSEFKTVSTSLSKALFYAFLPELIPHGPLPETLCKWDELLVQGHRTTVVAGSDAHALGFRHGFFRKTIFPYAYHFSTINNHLLITDPLTGDLEKDKSQIYSALRSGSSFIGFDLPAPTHGFTFTAETDEDNTSMGGEISIRSGATLRVRFPRKADFRLIHDGRTIHTGAGIDRLTITVKDPGAYRVESYIPFFGRKRGWIFSNPIYIQKPQR